MFFSRDRLRAESRVRCFDIKKTGGGRKLNPYQKQYGFRLRIATENR